MLINIPQIAKNEWHPFTISSSPEMAKTIWLHVRGVGTWTKKLYSYYESKKIKGLVRGSSSRRSLRSLMREERFVLINNFQSSECKTLHYFWITLCKHVNFHFPVITVFEMSNDIVK